MEELIFADALINVVDISDYDYRNKEKVTKDILRLANVNENKIRNMITVYNKCDLNPYMNNIDRINVISAYTGQGIDKFKTMLLSQ